MFISHVARLLHFEQKTRRFWTKKSRVSDFSCVFRTVWGIYVYEEIAADTGGNLFHTNTAHLLARICIELVERAALLVRGKRARAARYNVWTYVRVGMPYGSM